jgi:ASC-1-like (ASCH) protein
MITIWIKEIPFNNILSNKKTIEGRLNKGIFKKLNSDDIIKLSCKNNFCKVKITKINKFSNFNDFLMNESINNILPDIKNVSEGIKKYHTYYSPEKEIKYGVLGIHIKLI